MPDDIPASANPDALLRLMEADEAAPEQTWRPEDRAAMLRHELSLPLGRAVERLGPGEANELMARLLASPASRALTFAELLSQSAPRPELLDLARRVARAGKSHADPAVRDVAAVLYYASVLSARLRCAAPISRLSDADLATGTNWALAQPWVDGPVRSLFETGLAAL